MENDIVPAIGLRCKKCDVEIGCTHAYLDDGLLYVQGVCQECGVAIRFSCDQLLITLIGVNRQDKRVN